MNFIIADSIETPTVIEYAQLVPKDGTIISGIVLGSFLALISTGVFNDTNELNSNKSTR